MLHTLKYWLIDRASGRLSDPLGVLHYWLTHYYQNFPKLVILLCLWVMWEKRHEPKVIGVTLYFMIVFVGSSLGQGFNNYFVNMVMLAIVMGYWLDENV